MIANRRVRSFFLLGAALLLASLALSARLSAQPGSTCLGKPTTINGHGGSDTITGTSGNDIIDGGGGGDTINGGGGNDLICGGDGNDTIDGGAGDDVLDGGAGAESLGGGAGRDTVAYSERTAPVSASLDGAANDGESGEGDNIKSDVENILGGAGGDNLSGDANANILGGGAGNDAVNGNDGNDMIDGGAGNDLPLRGGAGDDTIVGGSGNDEIAGGVGNNNLFGGDGNDHIAASSGNDKIDGGLGTDSFEPGSGKDTISARDGNAESVDCEDPPFTFANAAAGNVDTADVDLLDTVVHCEVVTRGAKNEGANVLIKSRKAAPDRLGIVRIRLACPGTLHRRCRGTLTLRKASSRAKLGPAASYTILPGHSRTIHVALSTATHEKVNSLGKLVARAFAVEHGLHGLKTTVRAFALTRLTISIHR